GTSFSGIVWRSPSVAARTCLLPCTPGRSRKTPPTPQRAGGVSASGRSCRSVRGGHREGRCDLLAGGHRDRFRRRGGCGHARDPLRGLERERRAPRGKEGEVGREN